MEALVGKVGGVLGGCDGVELRSGCFRRGCMSRSKVISQ